MRPAAAGVLLPWLLLLLHAPPTVPGWVPAAAASATSASSSSFVRTPSLALPQWPAAEQWQEQWQHSVAAGRAKVAGAKEQLHKRLRELDAAHARLKLRVRFQQQALVATSRRVKARLHQRAEQVKDDLPRTFERVKYRSQIQLQRAKAAVAALRPGHLTVVMVQLLAQLRLQAESTVEQAWRLLARRSEGGAVDDEADTPTRSRARAKLVEDETTDVLRLLVAVSAGPGWNHVTDSKGVRVWRKYLRLRDLSCGEDDTMVPVVKAYAIVNAPAEEVFELLQDNARVHEYNDNCNLVVDLEQLNEDTKITWALSSRHGPFKPREFTTLVHFRRLPDGRLFVVNKAAERARSCSETASRQRPRSVSNDAAVRSEIFLGGTLLRPLQADPTKTEIVQITSIDIGGLANTRAGAVLVNWMTSTSPVNFIRRLEAASQHTNKPS